MKTFQFLLCGVLGILLNSVAGAQELPKPPPLPSPQNSSGPGRDLLVEHLARTEGISAEEAAERASILRDIQEIIRLAAASDPNAFGGVWVDHAPTFKITVAFAGQEDRRSFLEKVPPKFRRYVQLRTGTKPATAARQDVEKIFESLSAAGIAFQASFEPRTQDYVVVVERPDHVARAQGLIPPELRSVVRVKVGPTLRSFQTNVRTGDAIYGGWDLLNSSGLGTCSYGFAGRDSYGRNAILTAGHCATNPPYVIGADGSHLVQLPSWTDRRYGGMYDFRHHPTVGLQTGYWVYFKNHKPVYQYPQYVNSVNGFYSDGYFTVSSTLKISVQGNSNHYAGMPVCKSGFASGFTCGKVSNNWVSGTDDKGVSYQGFVLVSGSSQPVIAWAGDSGAAVFSFPDAGYNIAAYGVLKGGGSTATGGPCTGSGCAYAYMPIDRVNDATPYNLHTTQGLVAP